MNHEIIRGADEIANLTDEWNRLWTASRVPVADARLEIVRLHRDSFAADQELALVIVRDGEGRLVAGLPVVEVREHGLFRVERGLANEWHQCGQLLIDPDADSLDVCNELVDGMSRLRANHWWLDWIPLERPEWETLTAVATERAWGVQHKSRFEVGITILPETWETFEASLSRNSRQKGRSELKKIRQVGTVELEVLAGTSESDLRRGLNEAFDIEMQSWKGPAGSAIRCNPRVEQFFFEWAEKMNRVGLLRLFILRVDGKAIAFDFGCACAGWYRAHKVSFLADWFAHSPGNVLNQLVLQHLIADPEIQVADSVGPMSEANRRWSNDVYRLGRIVLAPGTWLRNVPGRALVSLLNARSSLKRSVKT